jgi:hypothetical protein
MLRRLLDVLDAGDVLTVTRLDRLARSTRDLLNTLAAITGKKAGFRSLGDTFIILDGCTLADCTQRRPIITTDAFRASPDVQHHLRRMQEAANRWQSDLEVMMIAHDLHRRLAVDCSHSTLPF